MDRLASPTATDAAFQRALSHDFSGLDALIQAERARRNSPGMLFDRLNDLLAYHRSAAMVQQEILAQSQKYVSGEYRADCRKRLARHATACKSLRKRIERLVKKGRL